MEYVNFEISNVMYPKRCDDCGWQDELTEYKGRKLCIDCLEARQDWDEMAATPEGQAWIKAMYERRRSQKAKPSDEGEAS